MEGGLIRGGLLEDLRYILASPVPRGGGGAAYPGSRDLDEGAAPCPFPQLWSAVGWLTAVSVMSVYFFGLYAYWKGEQLHLWVRTFYNCTCRIVWASGLAWIVYAEVIGRGGSVHTVQNARQDPAAMKISDFVFGALVLAL